MRSLAFLQVFSMLKSPSLHNYRFPKIPSPFLSNITIFSSSHNLISLLVSLSCQLSDVSIFWTWKTYIFIIKPYFLISRREQHEYAFLLASLIVVLEQQIELYIFFGKDEAPFFCKFMQAMSLGIPCATQKILSSI